MEASAVPVPHSPSERLYGINASYTFCQGLQMKITTIKKLRSILGFSIASVALVTYWVLDSANPPATQTASTNHSGESMFGAPKQDAHNDDLKSSELENETLGYVSKYGKLPPSLNGTLLDIKIETDEYGHLIITEDIKYLFDYFLSTNSEEDIDTIILRTNEYLEHKLDEPALSESKLILTQYIQLKSSLFGLEQALNQEQSSIIGALQSGNLQSANQYLEFLKDRLSRRNALRAEHLSPQVHDVFYKAEENYDEYTFSRLSITSDKSLTTEEKQQQLNDITLMLSEEVRASMKESQIIDELTTKTSELLDNGGDDQQVYELRRDMFGEQAAQRFNQLDQKRAQWQTRMNNYIQERDFILNTKGLAQDEIQEQVNALRKTHFEKREHIKVKVFEKRAEA